VNEKREGKKRGDDTGASEKKGKGSEGDLAAHRDEQEKKERRRDRMTDEKKRQAAFPLP